MGCGTSKNIPIEEISIHKNNNSTETTSSFSLNPFLHETGICSGTPSTSQTDPISICRKCSVRELKIKELYKHNKILLNLVQQCRKERKEAKLWAKQACDAMWKMQLSRMIELNEIQRLPG